MTRVEENKKNSPVDMTEDKNKEKEEKKELGKRLKLAREKRGYTQKQVAFLLDIVEQAYQKYEYGKITPKLDFMMKLAKIYETSIDELYGRGRYEGDLEKGIEYVTYINECLPYHRKRAGLTQRQVAERAGIPLRTYQAYEYGETAPNGKTIARLCKALGVSADYLFAPWQHNPNRLPR